MQFEASKVVAGGVTHDLIVRDQVQFIDIVEGTYEHYKIETKGILSPLKIAFRYTSNEYNDLKVMYSKTNMRPERNACERVVEAPHFIIIKAADGRMFHKDFVYFKFQTDIGC